MVRLDAHFVINDVELDHVTLQTCFRALPSRLAG